MPCFLLFTLIYFATIFPSFAYMGLPVCGGALQNHRGNCADLIDMPLCSVITPQSSISAANISNTSGNCVALCSSINAPSGNNQTTIYRGIDYAVHNRDCIRFCDAPESGVTAAPGINCTSRKCHQLTASDIPNKNSNCNIMTCNLLTKDELNDPKYGDDTKQYCDGNGIKCYNFSQDKLPYVKYRNNNSMCQIHDCPPSSSDCGADDTVNITNKNVAGANPNYQADYVTYINGGMPISGGLCKPIICKPIIYVPYRCLPIDSSNPTNIDTINCDPTSTCNNGYCTKKIDCNLSANSSNPECSQGTNDGEINPTDNTNSWFYRPLPSPALHYNNQGIITEHMDQNNVCESADQLDQNGYGNHPVSARGTIFEVDWGFWITAFESALPTRHCDASDTGLRGAGYAYLCGIAGSLYNEPDPNAGVGYVQGYAKANYELPDPEYKIRACLRYKATGASDTYCGGRRVCKIFCEWGHCRTQICGQDLCKDLTVHESSPSDCSPKNLFSGNSSDKSCSSKMGGEASLDSYIRIRAVKYDRRVCTYLDFKGTLAYGDQADYYNGSETLDDGTCVDGGKDTSGKCSGFDTNGSSGSADVWRTVIRIPYIGNNRPSGQQPGFVDLNGKFYPAQQCAKVPMRIGPSPFYNVATISNSVDMFAPPLYIVNARTSRGGSVSIPNASDQFGITDFYYPEIEVRFGGTSQLMSLSVGYNGDENTPENYSLSPSAKTIRTTINNINYDAAIYVKKDYDATNQQGLFCLYRTFYDGTTAINKSIGCVKRAKPNIRSIINNQIRKALVTSGTTNTYNNAVIKLQLMASQGANNIDNNCGLNSDDICSTQISFSNLNPSVATCSRDIEDYEFCAAREECSKLYNECADNEISLYNAKQSGQATGAFEVMKSYCNNILLVNCNRKWGVTSSSATDIFSQNTTNTIKNPKAYGWFNEICISKGFNDDLKNVLAYKIGDGSIMGKCKIDTARSLSSNCSAGGYAPNCYCIETPDTMTAGDGEEIRKQTPREAGLCIDIPKPNACPAIDYTPNAGPVGDPYFINDSLNQTSYSAMDISHQNRTDGTASGNAEFDSALPGMLNFQGQCHGFWKNRVNESGLESPPTTTCLVSGNWSTIISNPCERYSCPLVATNGIQADGNYQGSYGLGEIAETSSNQYKVGITPIGSVVGTKGSFDGFAKWDRYTKIDDFLETVTTNNGCIPGFKLAGSTLGGTSCDIHYATDNQNCAFTGGTKPSRTCNQIGQWGTVTNPCQRVYCIAINPPANPVSDADWDKWADSGGATFPSVNASRSSTMIMSQSVSTGACNANLGFYQSPGAPAPTRECNYLGQWGSVINPCVTECDAIDNIADASTPNNGFAYWKEANDVPLNQSVAGVFNGCVAGYIKSPYSPNITANQTIIFNTGNAPTTPARECTSVVTAQGQSNVWTAVQGGCINKCPGNEVDSRIDVGKTQHILSDGSTVNVEWSSATFGTTQYRYGHDNVVSTNMPMDVSMFTQGRNNGYFILSRTCGADGKWQTPIASCSVNIGQIGNADYSLANPSSNPSGSIPAGGSDVINGTCVSGFSLYTAGTDPKRQCVYDSGNKIDQVYLKLTSGTADCEKLCTIPHNNDNGTIWGVTDGYKMRVGEIKNGTCQNGYGYHITDGLHRAMNFRTDTNQCITSMNFSVSAALSYLPGADSSFATIYTDRTTIGPKLTCGSDGIAVPTNSCDACRACNGSSDIIYLTPSINYAKDYRNCCGNQNYESATIQDLVTRYFAKVPSDSIANNTSYRIGDSYGDVCGHCYNWGTVTYDVRGLCIAAELSCLDGTFRYYGTSENEYTSNDPCSWYTDAPTKIAN